MLFIQYSLIAGFTLSEVYHSLNSNLTKKIFILLVCIISLTSLLLINIQFSLFKDDRKDEYFVKGYYNIYKLIPPNSTLLVVQPQVFNFDFMRNKNLYIIDYHYYYRHPYKNVFLNAIKNKNNIYFVDIGMSNISNVDNNVLTLIYKYHGFKLYKINKTNEFISYLKN